MLHSTKTNILVLMECLLDIIVGSPIFWIIAGLNPCSNGMLARLNVLTSCTDEKEVLILVLMECLLDPSVVGIRRHLDVLILVLMECLLEIIGVRRISVS